MVAHLPRYAVLAVDWPYVALHPRSSTFKAIGRSPEKVPQLPRVVGVKADATDVAALTAALSGVRHR